MATSIAERLAKLRNATGLSQKAFAAQLGLSTRTWQEIEYGKNVPSGETLLKIAAAGYSPSWVLLGDGPIRIDRRPRANVEGGEAATPAGDLQNVVMVPRYDIAAAAGAGALAEDGPPSEMVPFPEIVLGGLSARARHLVMIEVAGDSMEPTFGDGQAILVDRSQRAVRDGIYVFRMEGQLAVKRLQLVGRSLSIISDNPAYPAREVSGHDLEQLRILGKVVWPRGR